MPTVKFTIKKPTDMRIESIKLASLSVSPTNDEILTISDSTLETIDEIFVNTSNPLLHVLIRASADIGSMTGAEWSFDITINGVHKTDPPEKTFVDKNGIADFTQRYPY